LNDDFPIHWLQEIVDEILERNEDLITLSTGKTPSGHIHVGILREIIICDSLRKILEIKGNKVRNLLFFDSFDAAKRFPAYIPKKIQEKHLGKPFSLIPCPFEDCKCESYAHHFGNELFDTFEEFGIQNEKVWTHELYNMPEMKKCIKIALENVNNIKEILRKYILPTLAENRKEQFVEMQETWIPVMVICENCNRLIHVKKDNSIIPNRVINYNVEDQTVYYKCASCGNENHISINSGRLKLNWRIDWPAKWSIFKTSCEPAGKDHSVKGGAYDTGIELCQVLFNYGGPVKVPYEWLRLGDYDMKTSKGIVFTPKRYLEIADPEIYRMLILKTDPMKHISLRIEELPQYYDYYEKIEEIYYSNDNEQISDEEKSFKFIYPLIKIGKVPQEKPDKIPLKLLTYLAQIQNILTIDKLYEKAKDYMIQQNFKTIITKEEFEKQIRITDQWLAEVKKLLENEKDGKRKKEISNKIGLFSIPDELDKSISNKLDEKQIQGIQKLKTIIEGIENIDGTTLQNKIFSIAKEGLNISPRKLFSAVYLLILGKPNGPKLGPFLKMLDKKWLLNRLEL